MFFMYSFKILMELDVVVWSTRMKCWHCLLPPRFDFYAAA